MTESGPNRAPERRPGSLVFGLLVGIAVAWWSYAWITDPDRRELRAVEERAVLSVRAHVTEKVADGPLEIVDPLAPRRPVGKVYIDPTPGGFQVSGYYRRDEADRWHEYLASIDAGQALIELKVRDDDAGLARRAIGDDTLTVVE